MSLSSRSQGTHRKLDPRKDKLAYFAGNIQTHDEEDFDPKIYYYQRQEKEGVGQPQLGGLGGMMSSNGSVLGEHASTPSRYAFAQQQTYMGHNGLSGSSRGAPPGMNLQNLQSASASGGMQSREQLLGRYAGASASQQMGMQQHGLHSMNSLGAMGGSMTVGGGRLNGTMQGAASVRSTTPTSSGAMRQVNPAAMMQNIGAPSSAGYNPSGDLLAMINSRSGGGSTGGMGILSASGGSINNTLPSSNNSSSSSNDAKEAISLHDMTQFPILGLNTSSSDSATLSLLSSASSSSSSAAAMAAKAAAAAAQPSSQKGTKEFAIQHEEFPALTSPQTLQHQHHQQQQQQQQQRYKSSGFPGGGNNGASNDLVSPQSPSGGEEVSGSLLHDDGPTDHNIYQQQQNASYPASASASLRKSGGALSNHVGVMPHSNASHYHHLAASGDGTSSIPGSSNLGAGSPYDETTFQQFQQRQMHQQSLAQQQKQVSQQPPIQQSQMPKKLSTSVSDQFGLLGLLNVIRMTDPDLNTLALGTDLTTLGLNLNSSECLYSTFASPFADGPSHRTPEYHLPPCYYTQPPMQPAESKASLFSEETLFYIFYSMPRDYLQLTAAMELYNRDWRFHKELQLWFMRVPGTEPLVKTGTYERGSYVFFDPTSWEKTRKDSFVLSYEQVEAMAKTA